MRNTIEELINRRREQVLIHSCLYYRLDVNIIDDITFDMWCKELAELQEQYPEISQSCRYAEACKDFDGSTGADLPLHEIRILNKARQIYELHRRKIDE